MFNSNTDIPRFDNPNATREDYQKMTQTWVKEYIKVSDKLNEVLAENKRLNDIIKQDTEMTKLAKPDPLKIFHEELDQVMPKHKW